MKAVIFSTFVVFAYCSALSPSRDKVYRSDYVYNSKTDAFYKLHIESVINRAAKELCHLESSTLMIPTNKEDINQLHGMLKQYPDIGEYTWLGDDGQKHDPGEDSPIIDLTPGANEERSSPDCDVMTRSGDIEAMSCFHRYPFACKIEAKDAVYNQQCQTYGTGFTYVAAAHSCYRVPNVAVTWDYAYDECRKEGSHLVIINSDAERDALKEFLKTAPRVSLAKTTYFYYAGIRANRPTDNTTRVFRTVFNSTLEEAGYSEWSPGEPNNFRDTEYCGTIFSNNGKYNDVNCSDEYAFICEKEVTP